MSATDVDAYLANLPPEKRTALERIRSTVRQVAPEADEVITYKMPGFKVAGHFFVSYDAYKNHFSLFPASEAVEQALGKTAAKYVRGRGTLQFRYDDPPPDSVLRTVVEARLAEAKREIG